MTGAPRRVVVVGGGFAGFECCRRLPGAAPAGTEVTLVNTEDYLLYTPLLPGVAGGQIAPRHIAVPLAESLPGVRVLPGRATDVDLDGHTLRVEVPGIDQAEEVGWDRLVLTCGSVTQLFDVPGLEDHAQGLKTLAEALYLRDHVLGELERSVRVGDDHPRRASRTVVVVGASYAGTELVAELRGLCDAAARHHGFDPGDVHFLLLDAADRVMPEVGDKLGHRVLDALRAWGVDVRLGSTLSQVDEDSVTLQDGTVIPARTVAWVTGVTAAPLVGQVDAQLEGGRLKVDACLGVPGHPDVFAAGDAAAVPDLDNEPAITPPTAQHAVRQGRVVAGNVAASLNGGQAKPYRHRDLGLVVDLGPRYAVANPFGIPLSGLAAKVVARAYHLASLPRTANRAQVLMDYVAEKLRPRSTASLGLVDARRSGFSGEDKPT